MAPVAVGFFIPMAIKVVCNRDIVISGYVTTFCIAKLTEGSRPVCGAYAVKNGELYQPVIKSFDFFNGIKETL